jgi:4-hydroxy-4-methyl-2-oxoglutarate aldolase
MSSLRGMLEELRDFDTAMLANTIGYIDPTPPHEYYMSNSIQSVTPALGPTVGVAVTCEMDTSTPGGKPDADGYWRQVEAMSRMDVPAIWVVKTVGSRPDHECIIGEGMAKTLFSAGCVGLVTDGGVRDVAGLLTTPFAAYCRGKTVHHCSIRIRSLDRPVEIGGIVVAPGDILHANSEGVIKIPRACIEQLPIKAAQMRAFEHEVHVVLRRTDMNIEQKRAHVVELLARYGFSPCTPA